MEVLEVPNYADLFLRELRTMYEQNLYCDAVILADGQSFLLHAVVLAASSTLLTHKLETKAGGEKLEIIVNDVPGEVMVKLVLCLYTGRLQLQPSNIKHYMSAALQLQMNDILKLCQDYLKRIAVPVGNAVCAQGHSDINLTKEPVFSKRSKESTQTVGHADLRKKPLLCTTSSTLVSTKPNATRVHSSPDQFLDPDETQTCSDDSLSRSIRVEVNDLGCGSYFVDSSSNDKQLIQNATRIPKNHPKSDCLTLLPDLGVKLEKDQLLGTDNSNILASPSSCIENPLNIHGNNEQLPENTAKHNYETDDIPSLLPAIGNIEVRQSKSATDNHSVEDQIQVFDDHVPFTQKRKISGGVETETRLKRPRKLENTPVDITREITKKTYHRQPNLDTFITVRKGRCKNNRCQVRITEQNYVESNLYTLRLPHVQNKLAYYRVLNGQLKMFSRPVPTNITDTLSFGLKKILGKQITNDAENVHEKLYFCCKVEFKTLARFRVHRQKYHKKRNRAVTPAGNVISRSKLRADFVVLNCRLCKRVFKHDKMIKSHLKKTHKIYAESKEKSQMPQLISENNDVNTSARAHLSRYTCDVCGVTCYKRARLLAHQYTDHGIRHPDLKIYTCDHADCAYSSLSLKTVEKHKRKHDPAPVKYECQECGKTIKTKLNLEKHIKIQHRNIKPFICEICGAAYGDAEGLRAHVNRHSDTKSFLCHVCQYAAHDKANLKSHLFNIHGEKLEAHMTVFKCQLCDFVSDRKYRFTDHMRVHDNRRDIACDQCDKTFCTRKALRSHFVKVHKAKTLECEWCGYRTADASKQREHVRTQHTHRHVKPYACAYCSFTCATSGNCRKHVIQKHPGSEVKVIRLTKEQLDELEKQALNKTVQAPSAAKEKSKNTLRAKTKNNKNEGMTLQNIQFITIQGPTAAANDNISNTGPIVLKPGGKKTTLLMNSVAQPLQPIQAIPLFPVQNGTQTNLISDVPVPTSEKAEQISTNQNTIQSVDELVTSYLGLPERGGEKKGVAKSCDINALNINQLWQNATALTEGLPELENNSEVEQHLRDENHITQLRWLNTIETNTIGTKTKPVTIDAANSNLLHHSQFSNDSTREHNIVQYDERLDADKIAHINDKNPTELLNVSSSVENLDFQYGGLNQWNLAEGTSHNDVSTEENDAQANLSSLLQSNVISVEQFQAMIMQPCKDPTQP